MKKEKLDKAFESNIRLNIMSLLLVEEDVSFNDLKEDLNLTDGNLASHIKALERIGYLKIKKKFVGKKPNTSYQASRKGRTAFINHLDGLRELVNKHK